MSRLAPKLLSPKSTKCQILFLAQRPVPRWKWYSIAAARQFTQGGHMIAETSFAADFCFVPRTQNSRCLRCNPTWDQGRHHPRIVQWLSTWILPAKGPRFDFPCPPSSPPHHPIPIIPSSTSSTSQENRISTYKNKVSRDVFWSEMDRHGSV